MDFAIEINQTFVAGSAAFISSIIVFCGSVFLLLALIVGARLAYMLSASITLAFVLMLALVWSFGTPLGPVGDQPIWNPIGIGTETSSLGFGPSSEYPEGSWEVPPEGDAAAAELETNATDYLAVAIEDGEVTDYEDEGDVGVVAETTRLLEQGGTLYGMITLEGLEGTDGEGGPQIFVVMDYDPGNPNWPARKIALGSFVLLAGHLVFLSRIEKNATRRKQDQEA
jgi:hypothetical protein